MCVQEIPPPGSYNVQQSYDKSQIHTEKAKPRTDAANRKHTSFMSAASRFAPPRDNVNKAKSTVDPDNPGTSWWSLHARDGGGVGGDGGIVVAMGWWGYLGWR